MYTKRSALKRPRFPKPSVLIAYIIVCCIMTLHIDLIRVYSRSDLSDQGCNPQNLSEGAETESCDNLLFEADEIRMVSVDEGSLNIDIERYLRGEILQ